MIQTSQEYKEAIVKGIRTSAVRLTFGVHDVDAKDDSAPSVNTIQPFTDILKIKDEKYTLGTKYATFEQDYFKLDGSFYLMPDDITSDDVNGWWSLEMSGEDRIFVNPPTITILFTKYHTSLGIGIYFGETYCEAFEIYWYDGEEQKSYKLVENNTLTECNIYNPVADYDKIIIKFLRTAEPYRYARVNEIDFGLTEIFTNKNTVKANIIEEVDPISSTLSINKLTMTVLNENQKFNMINPEGIYAYLQLRQKIVAQSGLILPSGEIEYVPIGEFYLSDWKNSTGLTAILEATDIIGILDKTTYYNSPFYINEPAYNVINNVLSDAGNFQFELSSDISLLTLTGYIPIVTHRQALQTILVALRACLRIERDGTLYIYRPDYNAEVETIANKTILGSPVIEQKSFVSTVQVMEYNYILNSEETVLFEGEYKLNGTDDFILPYQTYPAIDCRIELINATLESSSFSCVCAMAKITASGTFTIRIYGKAYTANQRVVMVSLENIPGSEVPQTASVADNTLITATNSRVVGQHILNYFQKRIKQTFNYLDNPAIQAGDCVSVETMFGVFKSGVVEKHEIQIAPALKGKLEVVG